jgi:hypothetical protein
MAQTYGMHHNFARCSKFVRVLNIRKGKHKLHAKSKKCMQAVCLGHCRADN